MLRPKTGGQLGGPPGVDEGFDTGLPHVGAGPPEFLWVSTIFGLFPWSPGRPPWLPSPSLGSACLRRFFCRQRLPCRPGDPFRSTGIVLQPAGFPIFPALFLIRVLDTCFFHRPEIVDFWDLGGSGGSQWWSASRPTCWKGFPGRRGSPDPQNRRCPLGPNHVSKTPVSGLCSCGRFCRLIPP